MPRRLPSPSYLPNRSSGRVAVAATAVVLALAATLLTALPGSATPQPTPSQVAAQLTALRVQEQKVTERYDEAAVALADSSSQLRSLNRRIGRLRGSVTAARTRLGRLAAAAYEAGGGLSAELSVLGSNGPQAMVDRAADLQTVSAVQAAAAQRLTAALHQLVWTRRQVATATAADEALATALAADRTRVLATISAEQALLSRLTAPPAAAPVLTVLPPYAKGAAGVAVRFAYAQIGKPYQWGSAGPDSYDCSGLTMRSWGAAGVGLPHSASGQQSEVASVPAGDLQPGDLIFFGSPAYHVGIYIGSGDMIDAPYSGTDVRIDPISGYSSAGRP